MTTQNISVQKKESGEVELTGEVSADELEKHRDAAAQKLGRELTIQGFRKGKAPTEKVVEAVGEEKLFREMADHALRKVLPELFREHKIDAIGTPHVTITKLAPGNPLGFKVAVHTLPEITLPDYKSIAENHNKEKLEKPTVSDDELEKAVNEIRKRFHEAEQAKSNIEVPGGKDLPELTDEFVKKLGPFKDVADFKQRLHGDLLQRKELQARDKRRLAILDDILKEIDVTIPDMLIENELNRMLARFQADVEGAGAKLDEYLKQINKTEDALKKEWRADAEKNVKTQLVLNKLAQAENIKPDEKRVETEVEHLAKHHPEIGSGQAQQPDKQALRIYVTTLLTNEAVFEFLENQKS